MQNKHYFFLSFFGIPTYGEGEGGVKPVGPNSQLLPKISFESFPYSTRKWRIGSPFFFKEVLFATRGVVGTVAQFIHSVVATVAYCHHSAAAVLKQILFSVIFRDVLRVCLWSVWEKKKTMAKNETVVAINHWCHHIVLAIRPTFFKAKKWF